MLESTLVFKKSKKEDESITFCIGLLPISSVYIQEKPRKIIIFGNLRIHTNTFLVVEDATKIYAFKHKPVASTQSHWCYSTFHTMPYCSFLVLIFVCTIVLS